MNTDTTPQMPLPAAGKLPLGPSTLPPAPLPLGPMPGGPPAPPVNAPLPLPPAGPPAPAPSAPMPAGPMPSFPGVGAPTKPPYDVELQSDGSAVFYNTAPDGSKVVLSVAKPPKVPPALQKPQGGM